MSSNQTLDGLLSELEFAAWFDAATAALTAGDSDMNIWKCLLASRTSGDSINLSTWMAEAILSGSVLGVTLKHLNRVLSDWRVFGPGALGPPVKFQGPTAATFDYVVPVNLNNAMVNVLGAALDGCRLIIERGAVMADAARVKGLGEEEHSTK